MTDLKISDRHELWPVPTLKNKIKKVIWRFEHYKCILFSELMSQLSTSVHWYMSAVYM